MRSVGEGSTGSALAFKEACERMTKERQKKKQISQESPDEMEVTSELMDANNAINTSQEVEDAGSQVPSDTKFKKTVMRYISERRDKDKAIMQDIKNIKVRLTNIEEIIKSEQEAYT